VQRLRRPSRSPQLEGPPAAYCRSGDLAPPGLGFGVGEPREDRRRLPDRRWGRLRRRRGGAAGAPPAGAVGDGGRTGVVAGAWSSGQD
jgi:hypothetical protein